MYKKTVGIAVTGLFLMVLPAWGLDMTPGKYEITTKVEMQGMPDGMPAQTTTQCLTEKDPVPSTSAKAQGCKITDMKTKGNTVIYTMSCDQQGMKTESTGKMTFKGESFEGKTVMKMGPSAGGMTVTTEISGKRIGRCE